MADTTTEDRTTTGATAGPDPTRAQPPAPTASSALALRAGQDDWTEDQRIQLRSMGMEHATEADLRLLYHYQARTGLDAFTKQLYMVSRRTKIKVRVTNPDTGNDRLEEREVDKFTVQVGIDGWRVIGNRAARRDGVRVGHGDTLWRGKGTGWQDYWDKQDGEPVACKYLVEFDGVSVSATCNYAEYVQLTRNDGNWVPNSMWAKMPANQLAKCAEALAWRKAFPADYSGLVLEDAAQSEIIDGQVVEAGAPVVTGPVKSAPRKAAGASRNAQRAARANAAPEPPPPPSPRAEQLTQLSELLKTGNVDTFSDAAIVVAELAGLGSEPQSADEISDDALATALDTLQTLDRERKRPLAEELDEVFNRWELRKGERSAK